MDRRAWIKTGCLAAIGAGLGGSAERALAPTSTRHKGELPSVFRGFDACWDRVIHTTVGPRPYRRSGFVVRAEKPDRKTLIHNYGHGGGGMSLTWGTAYLAACEDSGVSL